MIKKFTSTLLMTAIMAIANGMAFARVNDSGADKAPVKAAVKAEEKREIKNWSAIFAAPQGKSFDPASRRSTLSEHQAQNKAAKKFSTTTKVLIGVGIAAAVVAIVFVAARDDLKDDIFR